MQWLWRVRWAARAQWLCVRERLVPQPLTSLTTTSHPPLPFLCYLYLSFHTHPSTPKTKEACQDACQKFIDGRMRGFSDGTEARGWENGGCRGSTGVRTWVKETYCHTEKARAGEMQVTGGVSGQQTMRTNPGESYIDPKFHVIEQAMGSR